MLDKEDCRNTNLYSQKAKRRCFNLKQDSIKNIWRTKTSSLKLNHERSIVKQSKKSPRKVEQKDDLKNREEIGAEGLPFFSPLSLSLSSPPPHLSLPLSYETL